MRRPVLHYEDVLAWADEYHQRTGKFPTAKSGRIAGHPDEKWFNVDMALRTGLRGFPGGSSLPRLLAKFRGHRNRKSLPEYTTKGILLWADTHYRKTGEWPTIKSGAVADAPGETWLAIDMGLRHGQRGLPGGTSLAALLAKHRGVHNRTAITNLSVKQILEWADAHKVRTGNWPTAESGAIAEQGGETWMAVDQALKAGRRGLPGGSSLFRLLAKHRGVGRHVRHVPLSIAQILAWADAHKRRTGSWPKVDSGPIPEAPGETWQRIQNALGEGRRGLPAGLSIAKLLATQRGVRNIQDLPPLRVPEILEWIEAHSKRHGVYPTRDSGPIPDTDGETWSGVASALKACKRGLKDRSSLARLVAKCRGKDGRGRPVK
jgi:hypothetical protein